VASARDATHRKAATVLVIDDEDYVADMIAAALALDGYVVHIAYNGRQGLESVQNLVVDLVIIDIMMPFLSGEQLAAQIRAEPNLHTVPIIFISAGARPRRLLDNMAFVPKPFDIDDMLATVETCLGHPSLVDGARSE
jgi:DNA-binding response OmpR family regulator